MPYPWLEGVFPLISRILDSFASLPSSLVVGSPSSCYQPMQLLSLFPQLLLQDSTCFLLCRHVPLGRRPSQRSHQQKYALAARVTAQGLSSPSATNLPLSDPVSFSKSHCHWPGPLVSFAGWRANVTVPCKSDDLEWEKASSATALLPFQSSLTVGFPIRFSEVPQAQLADLQRGPSSAALWVSWGPESLLGGVKQEYSSSSTNRNPKSSLVYNLRQIPNQESFAIQKNIWPYPEKTFLFIMQDRHYVSENY